MSSGKSTHSTTPVFVSSTFADLEPYRVAVREALHRLEVVVRGMEYFGALPDTPKDECLRILRSCRFYIGIIAMRYGSIDLDTGKSFTQLEYEEALRLRLPTLLYLIDEERQPVLPKHIDFGEPGEKLREFKRRLKQSHVVSFFTSPEDLMVRVAQDLPTLVERAGTSVHRGQFVQLVESLPRVNWLTPERFAFLKAAIGDAAIAIPSDELLQEVLEFLLAGDRHAAVFLLSRKAQLELRVATDTLMTIDKRVMGVIQTGAEYLEKQRNAGIKPSN